MFASSSSFRPFCACFAFLPFAGYHFVACPHIPRSVREEFARITAGKRCVSSKASQAYWVQRGRDVGLVDIAAPRDEEKKVAAPPLPSSTTPGPVPSPSSESPSDGEEEEGGGVYFEEEAKLLGLTILAEVFTKMPPSRSANKGKRPGTASSSANKKARSTKSVGAAETTRQPSAVPIPAMPPLPSAPGLEQPLLNQARPPLASAGTPSSPLVFPASPSQNPALSFLGGNLGLPNIPAFTLEEEHQELESLSLAELAEVQSDVRGLSGLLAQPSNISALNLLALPILNQELMNLPAPESAAYSQAAVICPDQVSDDRKLMFLEHENCNARLAAKTMAAYWTHRVQLFGPARAFLPMTVSGAMKDEAVNMSDRHLWAMVPVSDAAGRSIFYHTPGRRDFSQYSFEQEMQAMWYQFETVIENATSRKAGVVILSDLRNYTINSYSLKIATLLFPLLSVLPTRVRAIHFCYPNPIVSALLPLNKRFMTRSLRLRLVVHEPSPITLCSSLNRYCFPADRIPTDLGIGGGVVINHSSWMVNRLVLENARHNQPSTAPPPTMTFNPAASGRAAAAVLFSRQPDPSQPIAPVAGQPSSMMQQFQRLVAMKSLEQQPGAYLESTTVPAAAAQAPLSNTTRIVSAAQVPLSNKARIVSNAESSEEPDKFSHLNDRDLYEHIMKERRRTGVGRKADPRMDKAVLTCLEDLSLPRMDALGDAGFVFPAGYEQGFDAKNPTDAEGISFQQRRDQLNRRLRQAQVSFFSRYCRSSVFFSFANTQQSSFSYI